MLVAGEAGAGKSALAKMGFQLLGNDTLALAFRAEEFARAHLDDVFAPFGINFFELKKATAGFTRKVLWIESIERLLEKAMRQAFTDLLSEIKADPTLAPNRHLSGLLGGNCARLFSDMRHLPTICWPCRY